MGETVVLALVLALFTGILTVVCMLSVGIWAPLLTGFVAGCIVGDINLGLQIGALCALLGLGFYTYGGATMPDFSIGAVFGVFMASQVLPSGAGRAEINAAVDGVLPAVVAIALLMSLFDILGRASTTIFQHGGDAALAKRNIKSFQRWHLAGSIPWGLSRAVPVFIGMLFVHQYHVLETAISNLAWLQRGLGVVGASLPAVGFALLLSFMDIKTYWPYMLAGYALFSFMGVPTVGLAIIGVAAAGLYMKGKKELAKGGN